MKIPTISAAELGVLPVRGADLLPKRYLHPGELEALVALVRSVRPRVMVEIGINEGRTGRAMLDNVPTLERYIGVDVLPGYVPSKAVQRREVPAAPGHLAANDTRFDLLLRPRGSLDLTPADLPAADVVFIDGDHGRAAVEHDTNLARRILRPGGLVIWHDYHDRGTVDVQPVLDDLFAGGADLVHVAGTWIVYSRNFSCEAAHAA